MQLDVHPSHALLGGALIGLAASLMLVLQGRVAGVSGILGGLLEPKRGEIAWRLWFVVGLVVGGLVATLTHPGIFAHAVTRSPVAVVVAGLLVGFGTRLGNGCTSGHGVCGISRFSPRSLIATLTFIATSVMVVLIRGSA